MPCGTTDLRVTPVSARAWCWETAATWTRSWRRYSSSTSGGSSVCGVSTAGGARGGRPRRGGPAPPQARSARSATVSTQRQVVLGDVHLAPVQRGVEAAGVHQLGVGALLGDPPLVEDEDPGRAADRGQPV